MKGCKACEGEREERPVFLKSTGLPVVSFLADSPHLTGSAREAQTPGCVQSAHPTTWQGARSDSITSILRMKQRGLGWFGNPLAPELVSDRVGTQTPTSTSRVSATPQRSFTREVC